MCGFSKRLSGLYTTGREKEKVQEWFDVVHQHGTVQYNSIEGEKQLSIGCRLSKLENISYYICSKRTRELREIYEQWKIKRSSWIYASMTSSFMREFKSSAEEPSKARTGIISASWPFLSSKYLDAPDRWATRQMAACNLRYLGSGSGRRGSVVVKFTMWFGPKGARTTLSSGPVRTR